MVRLLAALASIAILGGGVYLAHEYYNTRLLSVYENPGIALEVSNEMLQYFLIAAIAALFLVSLLVYLLFTARVAARRLAYKITQDIHLSQEQFRRFYEYSPVPYFLIDRNARIERPNTASVRLFGLTHEELVGQDIFAFLRTPDDEGALGRLRERALHKVPIEKKEVQVVPAQGAPRWNLLSVEYLRDPMGNHHGLVTLADIHEQKELDRIKTEFLSLASHQLRAPLADLKWSMDFLRTRRKDVINPEITGYLEKMYQRNEDMIDLVNTLLNMSRIEMGRIQVQKSETDMSGLVRSVVEEMEPHAREKQIQLTVASPEGVRFETDSRLMRIVLQNLLSNGIRYTPSQGHVSVRMEATPKKLSVAVEDTGIGIPTEEQGRIFQKMYRATNAKEMETNGNGIGLYMCKALMESMGGTISFTTTPGQGTTFIAELHA